MTWQNELQKLDEELASGRISADDYRRRRDEVLAQASSAAPTAAQPQPAQPVGPFPPPFRWEAAPPDSTQVMHAVPPGDAERTQVVPTNAPQQQPTDAERTQVVRQQPGDAERTQIVPGVGMGPQGPSSGGFPLQMYPPQPNPQSGPSWQDNTATPWGNADLPPAGGSDAWGVRQGPEVFEESRGGKGKIVGIVLAVVLLAGAAFGAYWLWGRGVGGAGTTDAGGSSSSAPTTSSVPPDPMQIGKVPGSPKDRRDIVSFANVSTLDPPYLIPAEIEAYTVAASTKAKLATAAPAQGVGTAILITQVSSAAAANTCALALRDIQVTNNAVPVTDVPAGLLVTSVAEKPANNENARVRAHYASKGYVIRIDVTAPTLVEATKQFNDALTVQLKAMPADA